MRRTEALPVLGGRMAAWRGPPRSRRGGAVRYRSAFLPVTAAVFPAIHACTRVVRGVRHPPTEGRVPGRDAPDPLAPVWSRSERGGLPTV